MSRGDSEKFMLDGRIGLPDVAVEDEQVFGPEFVGGGLFVGALLFGEACEGPDACGPG